MDSINWVETDSTMIHINTLAHESGMTITKDGETMYFSGGEVDEKGKLKYNKRGTSTLKLQKAVFDKNTNTWQLDTSVDSGLAKLNLENYSVGGPALNYNNTRLYFVTCAPYPEAKGQSDIYYVELVGGKIPDNPDIKNLRQVNTSGREMFPFISEDNILYFASDGVHGEEPAMGLLDLYAYDLEGIDNKDNKVISLGSGFNSSMDDFAYYVRKLPEGSTYSEQGFFSSNRDSLIHGDRAIKSKGDDDIYNFLKKSPKEEIIQQTITGIATAKNTGGYLVGATLELIDTTGMVLQEAKVGESGAYNFEVERNETYWMRGSMEWFYDARQKFTATEDEINIELELNHYPCEFTVYHNFESEAVIHDLDKENLLPVFKLLLANPEFRIRIESHTDSIGTEAYNMRLSNQRAEAYKDLLIELGVNEDQIASTKGFGESCPNTASDINNLEDVDMSDKHAKNRRSQFIIEGCGYSSPCKQ